MRRLLTTGTLGLLATLIALLLSAGTAGAASAVPRAFSALGSATVNGRPVMVDVVVAVPRGADAHAVAAQALAQQGARPIVPAALGSFGFTIEGWKWSTMPVQQYNSAGHPTGVNTQFDVQAAEDTWSGVSTSDFSFGSLTATDRCPSLVRECPGRQEYDTYNDVGWLPLSGRLTLGITWYATLPPYETDTALNTRAPWSDNSTAGTYDAQTVFLHEFGHTVGLGHSSDTNAVMYPTYHGLHHDLATDDQQGVTYLYPTSTTTVSGTVTSYTTGDPIAGARVTLSGTPFTDTTDTNGDYSISGVPYPVAYDITASAARYRSASDRQTITALSTVVDLKLSPKGKA